MTETAIAEAAPVSAAYARLLQTRGFVADPAQERAAARLDALHHAFVEHQRAARSWRRWWRAPAPPASVYLWGGVGRGKSVLMDCFFDVVPSARKRRVHFHAFMRDVQTQLRVHRSETDPLSRVVDDLAQQTRLLCFDEFHVSDIADAMILGRLLEGLLRAGVVVVLTSNYPPDGLYPGGLQRARFLPTITLIKTGFEVIEIDGGTDYRLRALVEMERFFVAPAAVGEQHLADDFERLVHAPPQAGHLEVQQRHIPVKGHAQGVVWFDFAALCMGPRSQNDYLDIAREHHTVLLSGIPQLSAEQAEAARRFTWLVDILYEHRVTLIASAAVEASAIYIAGTRVNEFARTVSRLMEMRGRDYLAAAHRSA